RLRGAARGAWHDGLCGQDGLAPARRARACAAEPGDGAGLCPHRLRLRQRLHRLRRRDEALPWRAAGRPRDRCRQPDRHADQLRPAERQRRTDRAQPGAREPRARRQRAPAPGHRLRRRYRRHRRRPGLDPDPGREGQMRAFVTLGLGLAALGLTAFAPAPAAFEVRLAPGHMDEKAGRGVVDVTLTIPDADVPAGAPLLTLPVVIANTDTIATTLTGLIASDAAGPIPLTVKDDPVAIQYSRHWIAGRAVKGEVTVHYRAPVDDTPPPRGSGPPYSLRTEGGGVSGVGNTFILVPEGRRAYPITLA